MDLYESKIKVVKGSPEAIYSMLTDMARLNNILPEKFADKVKDLQISENGCSFTVDKLGRVTITLTNQQPFSLVKYTLQAAMALTFDIFIQIKEAPQPTDTPESRIKVSLKGSIPFMVKPLVGGHLQELVDRTAEAISTKSY